MSASSDVPGRGDELAARRQRRFPLVSGHVEVVRVERPTPRLARIAFAGACLGTLPHDEPGEYVTLIWPRPGRDEVLLPATGWVFPPGGDEQHSRNYTIRRLDRDAGVVTIDLVLGGHGPGSTWAARARVGETLGLAGPRMHWTTDPDAAWTLLLGDETALPSIAATMEHLPASHPVRAVVEVVDAADEQPLTGPGREVTWLHRGDAEPGTGALLLDAVRELELPDDPGRVWAAGESLVIRDLREHLRGERGLPSAAVRALGYWKRRPETPWY